MSIEQRVKEIIEQGSDCKCTNLSLDIRNFGIDSLMLVEIILAFEEEFKVELTQEDIDNNDLSVNNLVNIIESKL